VRLPQPFGKYLLLERISVGGMAEVFKAKAFGVEGFEKIIAIKKILPSMAEDADFIQMFIDEAKICGQLNHANICQIFELGKHRRQPLHRDGVHLGQRCAPDPEPLPSLEASLCRCNMAAFVMASKVCEGLDYAHRKKDATGKPLNIIHRDVSPQNVIVSYDGEVKVIDFGIAKAASRSSKTQAGVLKGKFGYMSPEQVGGKPLDQKYRYLCRWNHPLRTAHQRAAVHGGE
jgi:serine/threonine protein kinase